MAVWTSLLSQASTVTLMTWVHLDPVLECWWSHCKLGDPLVFLVQLLLVPLDGGQVLHRHAAGGLTPGILPLRSLAGHLLETPEKLVV
mgnify:CR=1 FL=1